MASEGLKKYLEERAIKYRLNTSIKPYVTMKIGGKVRLLIVVYRVDRLKELLSYLHGSGYGFVLLGGGSNVVFSDVFSESIVIVNRTSGIAGEKGTNQDHIIKVASGTFNKDLMNWNMRSNAGGMEFLAGIPGTIGGAAAVNAGAFGTSISSILEKAEIFTGGGEIKTVAGDYFRFSYRDSVFKYGNEVILNVFLKFVAAGNDEIKNKTAANIGYRKENHPGPGVRSAGCFFKNPLIEGQKVSAGRLIEYSGFKGAAYETLAVSPRHANFIINSGSATFDDIKSLEEEIVRKVLQEKGIKLEREVIYISPGGKKY